MSDEKIHPALEQARSILALLDEYLDARASGDEKRIKLWRGALGYAINCLIRGTNR